MGGHEVLGRGEAEAAESDTAVVVVTAEIATAQAARYRCSICRRRYHVAPEGGGRTEQSSHEVAGFASTPRGAALSAVDIATARRFPAELVEQAVSRAESAIN